MEKFGIVITIHHTLLLCSLAPENINGPLRQRLQTCSDIFPLTHPMGNMDSSCSTTLNYQPNIWVRSPFFKEHPPLLPTSKGFGFERIIHSRRSLLRSPPSCLGQQTSSQLTQGIPLLVSLLDQGKSLMTFSRRQAMVAQMVNKDMK